MSCYQRTSNGYEISIDINGFQPDEVKIQTEDRCVIVTAEHVEQQDDGSEYSETKFEQIFLLPVDVALEELTTDNTNEGFIIIKVPFSQSASQDAA
ncbi:hypothetical protein JTE90_011384 [Oedothorax gibbosus]|uniref:SHSP domain-containing protein n=1 Tax=Oedothorax gibbosus TaxID=931172 RepID=A0AAV6VKA6_9ARAC|nr:hypothetical protein JTE90_011384 [Oedothorax gibbosus]